LRFPVRLGLATALVSALLIGAPPASAAATVRFERIAGFDAPGTPAKYDRVAS
jgi:hypothetical protein